MLDCDPCTGTLVIDGTSMHGIAWCVIDVTALWLGGNLTGDDRDVAGLDGQLAYRRRFTGTRHRLPMVLSGETNREGAYWADNGHSTPWGQLYENVGYLRNNVLDPGVVGASLPGVLTTPDGAVLNAGLNELGITLGEKVEGENTVTGRWGVVALATLDLNVPAGTFA